MIIRTLLKHGTPVLRVAMLLLITSFMLSGCLGGCYQPPPVKINVTLLNNATIPGLPLGELFEEDHIFDLPRICNLPSLSAVENFIRAALGNTIADRVKIEKVEVGRVTFAAKSGSFSTLRSLSMAFIANGNTYVLGQATNADGLGAGFDLIPEQPVDLLNIFFVEGSDGCINAQVGLIGGVPTETLVFDVTAELIVTVRIR